MVKKSFLFLSLISALIFLMKGNYFGDEESILENESTAKVSAADLNLKKSFAKILISKKASDPPEIKRDVASGDSLPKFEVSSEANSEGGLIQDHSIFLKKNFIEKFKTNHSKAERLNMLAILKDEIVADQIIINDSSMDKEMKRERETYLQQKQEIFEEMKSIVETLDGVELEESGTGTDG